MPAAPDLAPAILETPQLLLLPAARWCPLQVHCCLLALKTGRPIKMQYSREESFFGHVHRHPAKIWMRHHADSAGKIIKIEARMVFTSSYGAVLL